MVYFKLGPNYTDVELKREYKRLCKLHHPDLGGRQETFVAVGVEYNLLRMRKQPEKPQRPSRPEPSHNKPTKSNIVRFNIDPYGYVLYYPRSFAGAGNRANIYDVYLPEIAFVEGCVVDFGSTKVRVHPNAKPGEAQLYKNFNEKIIVYFWIEP